MKKVRIICKGTIDQLEQAVNNWLYYNQYEKVFFQFSQTVGSDGEGYFSCFIIYE